MCPQKLCNFLFFHVFFVIIFIYFQRENLSRSRINIFQILPCESPYDQEQPFKHKVKALFIHQSDKLFSTVRISSFNYWFTLKINFSVFMYIHITFIFIGDRPLPFKWKAIATSENYFYFTCCVEFFKST